MSLAVTQLIGFGARRASSSFTPPATSYANPGGTGNRTATITVTISGLTWDAGTDDNLVDGGTGANSTDSVDLPASIAAGGYFQFDFGTAHYIDEITIKANGSVSHGTWKAQVSSDGSSFADASAGATWNGTTSQAFTISPDNRYRYYRWTCPAGNALTNTWLQEFEFKIEA